MSEKEVSSRSVELISLGKLEKQGELVYVIIQEIKETLKNTATKDELATLRKEFEDYKDETNQVIQPLKDQQTITTHDKERAKFVFLNIDKVVLWIVLITQIATLYFHFKS